MGKTLPATGKSAVSTTSGGIIKVPAATTATTPAVTPGFTSASLKSLNVVNLTTGKLTPIEFNYQDSIIDIILQKNMLGTSTLTMQMTDPKRLLVNNLIKQGATIQIDGIGNYVLVQFVKASDQIQLVFESETVYRLRNQRGNGTVTNKVGTDVTQAMQALALALNPLPPKKGKKATANPFPTIKFVGADYKTIWSQLTTGLTGPASKIQNVALGRGTTSDPYEDTWTAMSRIASSVGWRLWEDNNTIYFGPDEWLLGKVKNTKGKLIPAPVNASKTPATTGTNMQILKEFDKSTGVQLIDFDWDVGKPFGQATVTCMMSDFNFKVGEVVKLENLGPANGYWLISAMQRDMYNPQASLTLQVPMPFGTYVEPSSKPLQPFPLTLAK